MKKLLKKILIKFSRILYFIIPHEFKLKNLKSKLEVKLEEDLLEETYTKFRDHLKKSVLFRNVWDIRKYAVETSLLNDKEKEYYYLEFGVYKGGSANYFSNYVKKLYAFDSFEGNSEEMVASFGEDKSVSTTIGNCNLYRKIPKLNSNVEPIIGWVEDTLDVFLKNHNPKINFIHFDMETYSPTKYCLTKLKPYLVSGAIIFFDELYNYVGWKSGEYRALIEVFEEDEYIFKAFQSNGRKCVIKIK